MITQTWAAENLYCLSCGEPRLRPTREGQAVVDFRCAACDSPYQLKSQRRRFRRRILDSAYGTMKTAISRGEAPSFLLMQYDPARLHVQELSGIPGFFLSVSALEERRPLSASARRAGWVGCNILLDRLPPDARVFAVAQGQARPSAVVRGEWARFKVLDRVNEESQGWAVDVLRCVRRLGDEFSLNEIYAFDGDLQELHPQNRNVPKSANSCRSLVMWESLSSSGGGDTDCVLRRCNRTLKPGPRPWQKGSYSSREPSVGFSSRSPPT